MAFFTKKREPVVMQLDPVRPVIILNFKTYKESSGANAVRLARIAERVQQKTRVNIIITPQAIDIREVAAAVKIPVYSQHVDAKPVGKSTGQIIAENLADNNVHGSLLNHSERRILLKDIKDAVLKLKEIGMQSIVCAKDDREAAGIAKMQPVKPDFIAVEPPELIGGEVSVSTAKPQIIPKAVKACNGVPTLIGAGIKENNDLKIVLQHGARGVILSSHFVLSKDPEKWLLDLVQGI